MLDSFLPLSIKKKTHESASFSYDGGKIKGIFCYFSVSLFLGMASAQHGKALIIRPV